MGAGSGGADVKRLLNQLWVVIGAVVAAFIASWVIYMPDAEQRGVWRAQSGGSIITLNRLQAKLYSESSHSCVEQLTFPAHLKLVEFAEGATVSVEDDTLMLRVDGALDPTPYTRIDTLPAACAPAGNATPREVFDAMWTAMGEHYAFFDLHSVNWDTRRALAPAPDAVLTDAELFDLLGQALDGLDDGHVQLGSPIGYFSPSKTPEWFTQNPYFTRDGYLIRADLDRTAHETVGIPLTSVELTGIEYALLPDGVGYISIRHMGFDTPFGARSEPAMAQAFIEVADTMAEANSIIIDLRYNPGGSDSVSFGIASHFTDQPLDVFTKTTRDGDTQTAPFTAILQPFDATPLSQPVIVLTSKLTGSAAEILTMALRELPQVTVMGEATSGGLSDILGFKLPNGWDLGLSHQTYRTMDGSLYEAIGIPPDVPFTIEATPLINGEDPLLRAAFERARGG
ncbi:S41 family peptidase [Octadecabacter ascidiaceicola]|uniref:Carboxy-terminal processing protease CtpB n=1 Tax=Octadecabacter ascidiaceicola TaxID=1655543 RepID=A0A238JP64_9RHOB|nr:S41 family peptidase [Octadecabacter ascidiaceicola]SMX31662.1 Carboxy-terminal processing protease CtpB precursor [Octadecabacter ascidiaceicola]